MNTPGALARGVSALRGGGHVGFSLANVCSICHTSPVALYQDAISATPGRCWRWVYAVDSLAPDHPTHCSEPVVWMGFRPAFGKPRVRFYACEKHADGLQELRRISR